MKPTFESTVDILVKAYLNDTLAHQTCGACAVGNIVAHAIGTRPLPTPNGAIEFDNNYFENDSPAFFGWYSVINGGRSTEGYDQIKATGYTKEQLFDIEYAFEHAPGKPEQEGLYRGKCVDPEWMFNGLMAVVDVLADIHGIDLKAKEEAKLLFVKH